MGYSDNDVVPLLFWLIEYFIFENGVSLAHCALFFIFFLHILLLLYSSDSLSLRNDTTMEL